MMNRTRSSSVDGPDKPTDRLIVMPPNHSLDIKVSKSTNQPKPKPKESLSHTQTIATGAGGVQPTNHDGEIEFVMRCSGHQKCRLVGMVSNGGHQLKWQRCARDKDQEWKTFPSPKINVINQLST